MPNDKAVQPVCLKLRYKQMFYKDVSAAPSENDKEIARVYGSWDTTAYWCDCTQGGRGPDDQPVNREACSRAGRPCHVGLEKLA
jgi:hypothetical protein